MGKSAVEDTGGRWVGCDEGGREGGGEARASALRAMTEDAKQRIGQ